MRKVLLAVVLGLGFWLTFLPGCRKETEVVTFVHHDTVYVQPDMCPDTTLPINCYTTYLRDGTLRRLAAQEDTLTVSETRCVWLGHCSYNEFTPIYKLCVGVDGGRIPDTAMCRAAGIPLCCPYYDTYTFPCRQVINSRNPFRSSIPLNDAEVAILDFSPPCSTLPRQVYYIPYFGPTQFISHPDSNPSISCSAYVQDIKQRTCSEARVHNCTLRVLYIPNRYDTVTAIQFPQGPTCCAPAAKGSIPVSVPVKIGIRCD